MYHPFIYILDQEYLTAPQDVPSRKRQRMTGPEGFQKPLVTPAKVIVPAFVSEFGKPGQATSSEQSTSKPVSTSKSVRPLSTSRMPPAFKPLSESPSKPVIPHSNTTKKPAMRTKLLSSLDLKPRTRPNYDISHLQSVSKPVGQRLQAPPLAEDIVGSANITPLRKVTLPAFAQPPVTPSKPTVSLNAIHPPRLSVTTPSEPLLPISKTAIARATDLATEHGTAELASIFLRDQHPDISNHAKDPDDVNGFWMGVSPEKGGRNTKGKGKEKFIRCVCPYIIADVVDRLHHAIYPSDGLAAHVSALFTRSNNSLALWRKEMEIRLASSHPVPPDLRACIVKILDMPHGSSPRSPSKSSLSVSSSSASRGVALCEILSHSAKTTRNTHLFPHKSEKQHHLVVLSFPSTAPTRASKNKSRPHVCNPEDFVEGGELHIWEPWQEVAMGGHPLMKEEEGLELSIAPFPLLPSSFPSSPSPARTPMTIDVRIADVGLLCSRFRVLREGP
jgi:hypothetical protein